jgi:negative regulator of sigma-B (phosphoserine phosphatase)
MTGGAHDRELVAWGWAGSALEAESGDLHVVAGFPGGTLVALIDGLGHGREAGLAASAAAGVLAAHAAEPVTELVQRCHGALRKTRGAVMSVASFVAAQATMTWLAVGNVDGVLLRGNGARAEGIASRGGVVGYQLPPLRSATLSVARGDTLILATDGIRSGFTVDLAQGHDPQHLADDLLARFAQGSDDAHVVVARYLGAAP